MLKTFSLGMTVAMFALTASPLHAQQQEAKLLKVEIPGQGFDLVFAMAKPDGATSDFRRVPDPLVIYSGDGELAFAIDDNTLAMFKDVSAMSAQACTFRTANAADKSTPVSVYVVPKPEKPGTVGMAPLDRVQVEPFMHKVEVPGIGLDIAFSTTNTPIVVSADKPSDALSVHPAGELFVTTDAEAVARMFKDVGRTSLPDCAFNVEHKNSRPLEAVSVYIFSKN